MLYNDHLNLLDLKYVQQLPEPNISASTYRNVLLMKPPVICLSVTNRQLENAHAMFKGLITVGRELRQQHPRDLLPGARTSRERSSRDVPTGQQITRVLLPQLPTDRDQSRL